MPRAAPVFREPRFWGETLWTHEAPVVGLAISSDGRVMVSVDAAGVVKASDLDLGQPTWTTTLDDGAQALALSASILVIASGAQAVRLHVHDGRFRGATPTKGACTDVVIDLAGTRIAVADAAGQVALCRGTTGRVTGNARDADDDPVRALDWAPEGDAVWIGLTRGGLVRAPVRPGDARQVDTTGSVHALAARPAGKRHPRPGTAELLWRDDDGLAVLTGGAVTRHPDVRALAWAPESFRPVVADADALRFLDTGDTVPAPPGITHLAVHPSEHHAVAALEDGRVLPIPIGGS